jgi:hypothetical protein
MLWLQSARDIWLGKSPPRVSSGGDTGAVRQPLRWMMAKGEAADHSGKKDGRQMCASTMYKYLFISYDMRGFIEIMFVKFAAIYAGQL